MGLLRQGGQQDAGRVRGRLGHAADHLPQDELQGLGVDMLLDDRELTAHPRVADGGVERRDVLDDEALQAQRQQFLAQAPAQAEHVVGREQGPVAGQGVARGRHRAGRGRLVQPLQFLDRQVHELARPVAAVQQALEQAQLLHLVRRVAALPQGVAARLREAVAALPDAQRVLGQARVAFDRGDRQGGRFAHP